MVTYEAMFIFPDRFKDEELDGVIKTTRGEIEKLGGVVISATRLGRRPFARPIQKRDNGHYAVVTFKLEKNQVPNLRARCKMSPDIVRVQIVHAIIAPAVAPAE